jgi:capsular exopolysaccharide synthesis family protein
METTPTTQPFTGGGQSPGERLRNLLAALRRHWRLILGVALVTTAAALAVSLTSTEKYDATAKLLLRSSEPIDALLARPSGASLEDPERETNTKVALIKLETVADRVSRRLRLGRSASVLLDQVNTEVEGTSDIVAVRVRDPNPRLAAAIANGFAEEYVAFRRESARGSLEEAADLARSRLAQLSVDERISAEGRQLEARLRELEIASSLQTGGAEIVRRAAVPTDPAVPRPILTAVLGLMLGLVLGVALAVLRELLDRRIKDEEDAQAVFGLPILATIPKPNRASDTAILRGEHDLDEAYGTLAANVLFSARDGERRVLMISSPRSGDGKTSATFGLARALTRLGQRVIAVEADLHHPRFVQICDIEQRGGLSALLAGVGELDDETVAVDVEGRAREDQDGQTARYEFLVLPAGPVPPNAGTMLSRPVMAKILEECRERADVVLIDTAPVGLVHDPLTLVNHADDVILVSRLGYTTKDAARQTLRTLTQVTASVLGVVLTGGERIAGYYGDADSRHYGRPRSKPKRSRKPKEKPEAKVGSGA